MTIGLVGRKIEKPHLEFRHLASDRMVLVAPPGHPLVRKKKVTVDHLAAHPVVLRVCKRCCSAALGSCGQHFQIF